ncbi:MAG TPA: hypothetical protein VGK26_07010 [Thermoanaerobaculia bacterium]|jgi:hypothetical protein
MSTLVAVGERRGTGIRIRAGASVRIAATAILVLAPCGACKRIEPPRLDALRAFQRVARPAPAFQPPEDNLLTAAQVDLFLRVRTGARAASLGEALTAAKADPGEFAWVRARIQEALLALDADRVFTASAESYARGLAALREARKAARDPKTIGRLDAEIATLERERGTLRRPGPGIASVSHNAALVSRRRAEIEAAGL